MPMFEIRYERKVIGTALVGADTAKDAIARFRDQPCDFIDEASESTEYVDCVPYIEAVEVVG